MGVSWLVAVVAKILRGVLKIEKAEVDRILTASDLPCHACLRSRVLNQKSWVCICEGDTNTKTAHKTSVFPNSVSFSSIEEKSLGQDQTMWNSSH